MDQCIFCKIIAQVIPAAVVYETPTILVIKDRAPKAPIHYLIIPKKHIQNCMALTADDRDDAADILYTAQHIAQTLPSSQQDFRLIMNNGANVGQSVFHWHMHFIAGKTLADF